MDKFKIAALSGMSYFLSSKKYFFTSQKKSYHLNFEINDNVNLFKRALSPENEMFYLQQDNEYLKWRIIENPNSPTYKSIQFFNNENILQAQVICSFNKNVAFIEQILFDRNLNGKIVYSLLKKIIKLFQKDNICLVRFLGFDTNILNRKEMNILKNMGFVFTKKGEQFAFKTMSGNTSINPYNIFLSRLYKQGIN